LRGAKGRSVADEWPGRNRREHFALRKRRVGWGEDIPVDDVRAGRAAPRAAIVAEPVSVETEGSVWTALGRAATVGIFLLAFGAFLYYGRALLVPILAAAVVALSLAPLVKAASRYRVSPWLTALLIVLCSLGVVALVVTAIAGPVSDWIGRAPEIGATIKQKLAVLEQPLAAARRLETALFGAQNASAPNVVLPVVAFLTPAAGELLLFFVTLMFFLVGQFHLRARLVALFPGREAKLRFLKIMNDIEKNLALYLLVVTAVNAALGAIVALGAISVGLPNPAMFGLLAALLNYVPYVGPAVMTVILFGVGLVSFPSLEHALVAPIGFVALTTAEGHFITPTIVGRRITLNPLLIFLALAFWTWMWGPIGAFLAAPLSIVGLVVFNHLFPAEDVKLPD
jgi:predicted PurR-regulated permease PerM